MPAPQPGRPSHFPKPIKILSKSALSSAWKNSRDSKKNCGSAGTDNITAEQFLARLDSNLAGIARRIRQGQFGFSTLRPVFVPKPDSDKERIICIPTVCDRLVQRVIAEYVTARRLFPIYNASSFGFIKGLGPRDAIATVIKLRQEYDWCLKTDIEAFFDRFPRTYLKQRVKDYLKASSITPFICNAIDCEAKETTENRQRLGKQGIRRGLGIRQGMPLSPLLANLALIDFDREIEDREIAMVRYADDLVLFFKSKEQARDGQALVKELLQRIQLKIPEIASNSKTMFVHRSDPLSFLGREIVYKRAQNAFVSCVSTKQIDKIKAKLAADYSLEYRLKYQHQFQDTIVDMSKSISAYFGIYKDAFNFEEFKAELRGQARAIVRRLFIDIFGDLAIESLDVKRKKFLGIDILDIIKPNTELDV
jgi:group II intron reverse transcriptase/maturase